MTTEATEAKRLTAEQLEEIRRYFTIPTGYGRRLLSHIDALAAEAAQLRSQLDAKDAAIAARDQQIADLRKQLDSQVEPALLSLTASTLSEVRNALGLKDGDDVVEAAKRLKRQLAESNAANERADERLLSAQVYALPAGQGWYEADVPGQRRKIDEVFSPCAAKRLAELRAELATCETAAAHLSAMVDERDGKIAKLRTARDHFHCKLRETRKLLATKERELHDARTSATEEAAAHDEARQKLAIAATLDDAAEFAADADGPQPTVVSGDVLVFRSSPSLDALVTAMDVDNFECPRCGSGFFRTTTQSNKETGQEQEITCKGPFDVALNEYRGCTWRGTSKEFRAAKAARDASVDALRSVTIECRTGDRQ